MAKVINTSEFQKEVLNKKGVVLVDFFAQWCGPCKMIAPILQELATEVNEKAKIYKVDVDQSGDSATAPTRSPTSKWWATTWPWIPASAPAARKARACRWAWACPPCASTV